MRLSERLAIAVALFVGISNTVYWLYVFISAARHGYRITLTTNTFHEAWPEIAVIAAFLGLMIAGVVVLYRQPIAEPVPRNRRAERAARQPRLHTLPARAIAGKLRPELRMSSEDV